MRAGAVAGPVVVAVAVALCGCGLRALPSGPAGGDARPGPPEQARSDRGTGVRGRVVGVRGEPGGHCLLEARAASAWAPPVPDRAVISDAEGRYFWALPEATYTIAARCGADRGRVEGVEVVRGRVAGADIVVR
ncbi:hypothetical protein [Streptomonospora wellingtoniae]|uniref:Carboxypeptidase regulatory-like domain-containing protein n=1 Tax=Streptomonospora wellingtoniae TaxID=3075544 RepID=A0ABU2KTM0_9ACTN|nr:hypothetical protein [Streptomonospora sp. DSM 45055]MDT0302629.1 hypothetical protein [Streptomonospora sp. DSM 45055]